MEQKKYNTDFYDKIILYNSKNAKEFNEMRLRLTRIGFIIKKIVLTDDGEFKLLAKIQKKSLVKCLLLKKNIPDNDRVYPKCNTYPDHCEFYKSGICHCVDHSFCLYQDTKDNRNIINKMVSRYNSYDKEFHDSCSSYYEDTELGRIFSYEYNHLNTDERNHKKYYRHNGN